MSVTFRWHNVSRKKDLLENILLACKRNKKKSKGPCDGVQSQCQSLNKKTREWEAAINDDFVEDWVIPSAQYLLVASEDGEMRGFLIGTRKKIDGQDKSFYIDLVCSRHRKGKDLLMRAEIFALSLGLRTVTLRAASPALIRVYRRRGFSRDVDACKVRTRTQRRRLRELDRVASALFSGQRDEDDVPCLNKRGDPAPKIKTKRKCEARGYTWEGYEDWKTSGEGWWMSKCCVRKSSVSALKKYIATRETVKDRKTLRDQLNRGIRKLSK